MINALNTFWSNSENQIMLSNSIDMFIQLFTELTLLFIVISFLVSMVNQKLPAEKIQRLLSAQQGRGYLTAAGLGAVTPFCSCSTIPMLIGLLNARAGFGPTMTFLFTSPLLNPIVIALFIPILGLTVTLWYAGLALFFSITAGVLLQHFGFERFVKQQMLTSSCSGTHCSDKVEQTCGSSQNTVQPSAWKRAWRESWGLFRTMFPYMLIAMIIGALVHGFVPANFFASMASDNNPAAIPTAALIGIPLYVRVTALLPLVASFLAKGVSMGAIIALIIGSGGASLPEMILLKKLFRWQMMAAFLSVIFSMAVIAGFTVNYIVS